MVRLFELKQIDEALRGKHFFKEFNFNEVDITDIFDMLENNGYKYEEEEKRSYLSHVKFAGVSGDHFLFRIGCQDENYDEKYIITTIYAKVAKSGNIIADYAGVPDKEGLTKEQAEELLK